METYLRLMFLKFRYRLGYESLCREVSDSITWRRFCRIPLEGRVPHPTTLMKLTTRCGSAAVEGLNEVLLAKAAEAKLVRTNRVRVDTTVVPSNVAYPTDSGLLAKAIGRIAATTRRIQTAGGAVRTKVRNRSRAAGRRAHQIGFKLRSRSAAGRDEALAAVRRVTGELADLAETAVRDAERLVVNAKRALRRARAKAEAERTHGESNPAAGRRRGRLARAVDDLTDLIEATRQIAAQTRRRLSGVTPDGATRRVSLHDPDARPIAKEASANRSSSATRPRSPTTRTGSCSTTPSRPATPPTRPSSSPRSSESSSEPADLHGPSPPTAATERSGSMMPCTISVSPTWRSHARANPGWHDKPRNTEEPSAATSNSAPGSKAGSAPSNAATDGTAHASTPPKAPGSGPATGS